MAYTTYDTGYNNQFGYPLQHSLSHGPVYGVHPTEYGYQDPAYGGAVYSDVSTVGRSRVVDGILTRVQPGYAPQGVYPAFTPQRSVSQFGRGAFPPLSADKSF